jgi:hypothetical protein
MDVILDPAFNGFDLLVCVGFGLLVTWKLAQR